MDSRPDGGVLAAAPASAAEEDAGAGFAAPTEHTQEAYAPEEDFTAKWTRADAMQLQAMSDPDAASRENSMPEEYTMPTVSQDFPDMSTGEVWVWDSWTLTDGSAAQPSFKGWEVVFSLVADRDLGFDDRHTYARLGYFFRKADVSDEERPENGGWTYGGHVFPDGASGAIFEDQSFSHQTEWSGSTRIFDGNNKLRIFYTDVAFYRNADGSNIKPYDPRIVQSEGRIYADEDGVWLTGFRDQHDMLQADGEYYQNGEQNEFFNFRDPFTFEDPAYPGQDLHSVRGQHRGCPRRDHLEASTHAYLIRCPRVASSRGGPTTGSPPSRRTHRSPSWSGSARSGDASSTTTANSSTASAWTTSKAAPGPAGTTTSPSSPPRTSSSRPSASPPTQKRRGQPELLRTLRELQTAIIRLMSCCPYCQRAGPT